MCVFDHLDDQLTAHFHSHTDTHTLKTLCFNEIRECVIASVMDGLGLSEEQQEQS